MRPVGKEVTGILNEMPTYDDSGHIYSIRVGDETLFASHKKPHYVLFRVDRNVAEGSEVVVRSYAEKGVIYRRVEPANAPPKPIYDRSHLPGLLFLAAGLMTLLTLGLLWYLLPDLFRRTAIWWRTRRHASLETAGMLRLPPRGPAVLLTDAPDAAARDQVVGAADRVVHFFDGAAGPEAAGARGVACWRAAK